MSRVKLVVVTTILVAIGLILVARNRATPAYLLLGAPVNLGFSYR